MPAPKRKLVDVPDPVAILDEHLLLDNDGKPLVYLDEQLLEKFCEKLRKKFSDTGDAVPITDGHTRDGAPANEQPEIVGFAYPPYTVRQLGKSGRKAIHCKWKIYEDKVELVRSRPRRSVEIWPSRWDIDPVAVLGAETPDRYLGPIKMSNTDRSFTRTMEGNSMDPTMVGQVADAVMARLEESSWVKAVKEMVKEFETMQTEQPPPTVAEEPPVEGGPPGPEGAADGLQDEQPEAPVDEDGSGEIEPDEEEEAEMPVKKDAMAAAPSGQNTFVPGQAKVKKQRAEESAEIKLARLQRENAELKVELADKIKKRREADREKDLVQLEALGYELDRTQELEDHNDFDDDRWGRHLEVIKKQYRQDVTRTSPFPEHRRPKEAPIRKSATEQDCEKARDLALTSNRPFEVCLAEVSQNS